MQCGTNDQTKKYIECRYFVSSRVRDFWMNCAREVESTMANRCTHSSCAAMRFNFAYNFACIMARHPYPFCIRSQFFIFASRQPFVFASVERKAAGTREMLSYMKIEWMKWMKIWRAQAERKTLIIWRLKDSFIPCVWIKCSFRWHLSTATAVCKLVARIFAKYFRHKNDFKQMYINRKARNQLKLGNNLNY